MSIISTQRNYCMTRLAYHGLMSLESHDAVLKRIRVWMACRRQPSMKCFSHTNHAERCAVLVKSILYHLKPGLSLPTIICITGVIDIGSYFRMKFDQNLLWRPLRQQWSLRISLDTQINPRPVYPLFLLYLSLCWLTVWCFDITYMLIKLSLPIRCKRANVTNSLAAFEGGEFVTLVIRHPSN